jgi:hypothetical protein
MTLDMTRRRLAILPLLLLLLASRPAAAGEWLLTGFAGATFRASTGFVDVDQGVGRRKLAFGGSAAWLSDRWLGCEGEMTLVPRLFEGGSGLVPSSRAFGAHVNLLVMPPRWLASRIRPYGTLGGGAIAVRASDVAGVFNTRTTLAAINAGAGVLVRLGSRFAVRGDLRYFRTSFREPPPGRVAIGSWYLHFWRGSAGLVVQF